MSMRREYDGGFTLVELLVGIFVGAVVLTMAIAIVVSTNRTSIQLMSRQEVSQSTRVAMTQVLKSLGSAQSLLNCRVWSTSADSEAYQEYRNQVNAWDGSGSLSITATLPSGDSCQEYFETGDVLVYVSKNAVCWNKDLTEGTGIITFSEAPQIACLVKPSDLAGDTPPCFSGTGIESTSESLHYYECRAGSSTYFMEPVHFIRSSFSFIENSNRELVRFTPGGNGVSEFLASVDNPLGDSIFSFERTDGSTHALLDPRDTKNIEVVYITLDILYRAAGGSGINDSDFNVYRFSQKILLQGARAFLEQGAFGGNYEG